MEPSDEHAVGEFVNAWGTATRPTSFGDPNHCDECAEANRNLLSLDRDDLERSEMIEPSKAWFYAWMNFDGWLYFLPGIITVAMRNPTKDLGIALDHLRPEWLTALPLNKAHALHELLNYCRACGYASDLQERESLQRAILLTSTK